MENLTQVKTAARVALPQLTDAQLTELGWTAGQIKEVRKYLKTPGFQRNAHQRGLCRRYSDAQRVVTPVTADARFTGGKVAKAKKVKAERRTGVKTRWSTEENKLAIEIYLAYFGPETGALNNEEAVALFQETFPARTYASVNMKFAQIRGLDGWDPCDGLSASDDTLDLLQSIDAVRFSA